MEKESGISSAPCAAGFSNVTTVTSYSPSSYGDKILIDTIVKEDSIELVYKAYPTFTYTLTMYGPDNFMNNSPRIWKEIYKCIDGSLKMAETVEGQYIPPSEESYEFD